MLMFVVCSSRCAVTTVATARAVSTVINSKSSSKAQHTEAQLTIVCYYNINNIHVITHRVSSRGSVYMLRYLYKGIAGHRRGLR